MSHSPDGRIQGVWKKFNSKNELQEIHSPGRVSVQGVESLWGDCRFIPADWGS